MTIHLPVICLFFFFFTFIIFISSFREHDLWPVKPHGNKVSLLQALWPVVLHGNKVSLLLQALCTCCAAWKQSVLVAGSVTCCAAWKQSVLVAGSVTCCAAWKQSLLLQALWPVVLHGNKVFLLLQALCTCLGKCGSSQPKPTSVAVSLSKTLSVESTSSHDQWLVFGNELPGSPE